MNITIHPSVEDAVNAQWITVVIDVFRAFSTEMYVFNNWAETIIPVQTLEEAYSLKKQNPEYILMWERGGVMPEWFDYGNSPTEIQHVDFSWKTVIHTTSNWTKGLLNSVNATDVLTGSFLNVNAIVEYIKNSGEQRVSLVSTSHMIHEQGNEDMLCAYYIRDLLNKKEIHKDELASMMKKTSVYALLFDEVDVPATDFDLCIDVDAFDFVIKQETENWIKALKKTDI